MHLSLFPFLAAALMACFDELEKLLRFLEDYERDANADKSEFILDCKARIFSVICLFLQHPLGENMSLSFSHASDKTILGVSE